MWISHNKHVSESSSLSTHVTMSDSSRDSFTHVNTTESSTHVNQSSCLSPHMWIRARHQHMWIAESPTTRVSHPHMCTSNNKHARESQQKHTWQVTDMKEKEEKIPETRRRQHLLPHPPRSPQTCPLPCLYNQWWWDISHNAAMCQVSLYYTHMPSWHTHEPQCHNVLMILSFHTHAVMTHTWTTMPQCANYLVITHT